MERNRANIVAVIPAFNETETVETVVQNLSKYVCRIIVVDDGSTDDTAFKAKVLGAMVIKKNRNEGYDKALNDGFKEASKGEVDIIITFDADAQHDARDIEKIVKPLIEDEADVVVGMRAFKQRVMEHLFGFYSRMRMGIRDPLSGVKAYSIDVYRAVGYFDNLGSTGTQLMFEANRKGFRLVEVPISFYKRRKGRISRFGKSFVGNYLILKSLLKILKLNS